MRDAWRLALGTLTTWPVPPPRRVDATVAGRAMLLAPLALVPLLALLGAGAAAARLVGAPAALLAALLLAALALSSRAMHLDGLADTADGLSVLGGRERALAAMKRSDVGPSGVAAVVLVLFVQAAALTALVTVPGGLALAAVAVLASRHALAWACRRGRPAAAAGGRGAHFAGTVPTAAAAAALALLGAVACGLALLGGAPWWHGPVVVAAALAGALALLARTRSRLGGVTGDVLGATIEVSLLAALVAAALLTA